MTVGETESLNTLKVSRSSKNKGRDGEFVIRNKNFPSPPLPLLVCYGDVSPIRWLSKLCLLAGTGLWQAAFHLCFFMLKVVRTSYWLYNFLSAQLVFYFKRGKLYPSFVIQLKSTFGAFFVIPEGVKTFFIYIPLSPLEYRRSNISESTDSHTAPSNLILKCGSFVTTTIKYLVPCIYSCYQYASTSARYNTLPSSLYLHITWELISVTC